MANKVQSAVETEDGESTCLKSNWIYLGCLAVSQGGTGEVAAGTPMATPSAASADVMILARFGTASLIGVELVADIISVSFDGLPSNELFVFKSSQYQVEFTNVGKHFEVTEAN